MYYQLHTSIQQLAHQQLITCPKVPEVKCKMQASVLEPSRASASLLSRWEALLQLPS